MNKHKLNVFDLDGTLAPSKTAIDKEMAQLLKNLLDVSKVSIISGGAWPQFQKQVLNQMPKESAFKNLSILPTCGTRFYQFDGRAWNQLYAENFTDQEKIKILTSIKTALKLANLGVEKTWGPQIEDRGSQITFSALGQKAPLSEKVIWDPDLKKRNRVKNILNSMLKGFQVSIGGSTSIDITKLGIDKGYGINKLNQILNIQIKDMFFVGDALFEGGNDYPVKRTGIASYQVNSVADTKNIINQMINAHTQ